MVNPGKDLLSSSSIKREVKEVSHVGHYETTGKYRLSTRNFSYSRSYNKRLNAQ